MQRYDVFFKRIISEYAEEILKLLNIILNIDCGTSVKQELPVEIVKGALRVDKIIKTDNNKIVFLDFEDVFTLDAYFEMTVHIHAHIRATNYYYTLLKRDTVRTHYVPVILSIRYNQKHMKYLQRHNAIQKMADGLYYAQTSPFGAFFILVLSELSIIKYMLRILNLCESEEQCNKLSKKLLTPDIWENALVGKNAELKEVLRTLLSMYGELFIFANFNFRYMLSVWRFSRAEVRNKAKVILDSLLLLFKEEVSKMNVSKLLTKSEKKEIIKALGIKEAVEAVGIKTVIEEIGLDKVIEEVGIDNVINEIAKSKSIGENERKELLKILKKIRKR